MKPDTRLMEKTGFFDAECCADCSGKSTDISRMIMLYNWLRIHSTGITPHGTIATETDMMNYLDNRGPVNSPIMNPSAAGPEIYSISTGSDVMIQLRKTNGKNGNGVGT